MTPARVPAWLVVALVLAIGLNLRASLGSIPPLLDAINRDLHLSNTAAGLLTSVAVVFMGLSAPLGQRLAARIGAERATGLIMFVLAVAGLLRAVPWGAPVLFASVALGGAAMGGVSALMPALIGHHVPTIRGLVTGVYSTGLSLGVAIAAGTAVPLEALWGDWRPALATWGAVATATAVGWALVTPRLREAPGEVGDTALVDHRMPWRSPTAWWITAFSSSQMVIGFSGIAWITPYFAHAGMDGQEAATMLVLFQVVQLATMLTLPAITDHTTDRRPFLALVAICTSAGIAMMLLDPLTLAVPALALFGMGIGGGSTLGLVLIVDAADTRADAARLGAMCLLVAFLAGALGPVVLGLLRDLTGGFGAGYASMLAISLLVLVAVAAMRPGRKIHDAAEEPVLSAPVPPQR